MNALTEEELEILFEEKSEKACLSIYLPTAKAGQEILQSPIKLKNALKEAKKKLLDYGLSGQEANDFLKPARKLIDDTMFWQHQKEGLAIFIAPDQFKYYRLPLKFDTSVMVDTKFNIKPLIPYSNGNSTFYLLALSQNENRLLKCTQNRVEEIEVAEVPDSLEDTLQYDDGEVQIQSHASNTGGKMIFHGQGADKEDHKEDIKRYLRQIDQGLKKELDGESPLMVMSVDYLFHMYKECNSYPHLLGDKELEGNPENLTLDELHKKGRDVIDALYVEEMKEAVDKYRDALGGERSISEYEEIVPAAYNGQVELLFLPPDVEKWGLFDKSKNDVFINNQAQKDSELFNLAALYTVQNGGKVYTLPKEDGIFDKAPMAALLRYQY